MIKSIRIEHLHKTDWTTLLSDGAHHPKLYRQTLPAFIDAGLLDPDAIKIIAQAMLNRTYYSERILNDTLPRLMKAFDELGWHDATMIAQVITLAGKQITTPDHQHDLYNIHLVHLLKACARNGIREAESIKSLIRDTLPEETGYRRNHVFGYLLPAMLDAGFRNAEGITTFFNQITDLPQMQDYHRSALISHVIPQALEASIRDAATIKEIFRITHLQPYQSSDADKYMPAVFTAFKHSGLTSAQLITLLKDSQYAWEEPKAIVLPLAVAAGLTDPELIRALLDSRSDPTPIAQFLQNDDAPFQQKAAIQLALRFQKISDYSRQSYQSITPAAAMDDLTEDEYHVLGHMVEALASNQTPADLKAQIRGILNTLPTRYFEHHHQLTYGDHVYSILSFTPDTPHLNRIPGDYNTPPTVMELNDPQRLAYVQFLLDNPQKVVSLGTHLTTIKPEQLVTLLYITLPIVFGAGITDESNIRSMVNITVPVALNAGVNTITGMDTLINTNRPLLSERNFGVFLQRALPSFFHHGITEINTINAVIAIAAAQLKEYPMQEFLRSDLENRLNELNGMDIQDSAMLNLFMFRPLHPDQIAPICRFLEAPDIPDEQKLLAYQIIKRRRYLQSDEHRALQETIGERLSVHIATLLQNTFQRLATTGFSDVELPAAKEIFKKIYQEQQTEDEPVWGELTIAEESCTLLSFLLSNNLAQEQSRAVLAPLNEWAGRDQQFRLDYLTLANITLQQQCLPLITALVQQVEQSNPTVRLAHLPEVFKKEFLETLSLLNVLSLLLKNDLAREISMPTALDHDGLQQFNRDLFERVKKTFRDNYKINIALITDELQSQQMLLKKFLIYQSLVKSDPREPYTDEQKKLLVTFIMALNSKACSLTSNMISAQPQSKTLPSSCFYGRKIKRLS